MISAHVIIGHSSIIARSGTGIAVSLAFAVAACSPVPTETPTTSGAVWGNGAVVEELVIGVEAGPEEYMLGSVRDIGVAPDGTMYVSDSQPTIVRAYDRNGNFLHDVGRQGQGPGEYAYPPELQVLSDGRLVMWDWRSSRVSLVAPAGEFLNSFPGPSGANQLYVDPEDHIYVMAYEMVSREVDRLTLVKYSTDGEELDRIPMPAGDRTSWSFSLAAEGGISSFGVRTSSTFSPLGYVVTGRNDIYDIELRKPAGTVHIRRDVPRVAVGPEERAEWEVFRTILEQRSRMRDTEQAPDPVPDVKPFFREISVGDDGRIWVFRYVAAEKRDDVRALPDDPDRPLLTWREPWTYDVFEPDGTFLGSVVVPELIEPLVFRGDRIWGALIDEQGIERVVRLLGRSGESVRQRGFCRVGRRRSVDCQGPPGDGGRASTP